jgi:ribosomal protein L21
MEYAVIQTGGKQYKVSKGDSLKIEKIKGDFAVGDKIVFDKAAGSARPGRIMPLASLGH